MTFIKELIKPLIKLNYRKELFKLIKELIKLKKELIKLMKELIKPTKELIKLD